VINNINTTQQSYDVAVVGGGMGGLCAALAAARNGARTVLIQDRPVLGGNASSEIRMHITGALGNEGHPNRRETGIIEEILLENKFRNPEHSYGMFDGLLWEKARFQENLTLYLNTYMKDVVTKDQKIIKIYAFQLTSEKVFEISAQIFVDATGDGILSCRAGAEYMFGREDKRRFGEVYSVSREDSVTMGNSIMFRAIDAGHPVKFDKPFWAHDYRDAAWARNMKWMEITSGYWWLELGGTELNIIADSEETKDELLKCVYGIWDYIKNAGTEDSQNMVLDWVGMIPAKRESRRITGDYILNENDLEQDKQFGDAVAYGGWHIDTHMPERFVNQTVKGLQPNEDKARILEDIYQIPYRCLYARDIKNLMMSGRIISASHRAFASARVMATCSVCGQAVGTAAAMAAEKGVDPKAINHYMKELQQKLLTDDCFIPNVINEDPADKALLAQIECSEEIPGCAAENIISGVARTVGDKTHMWAADLSSREQYISLHFKEKQEIGEIRLVFDSNLSVPIMQSISEWIRNRQSREVPDTIVSDYRIELFRGTERMRHIEIIGNYQRLNVHTFEKTWCDTAKITVIKTNGCETARIFEVRVY